MRYLLARSSQPVLARLASSRTLCAFDFDGTLAPIVDHPGRARLSRQTRPLLRRLAALYPCIILSGRARADLLGKLRGIPLERVFGSHGAEAHDSAPERPFVKQWRDSLGMELHSAPGVWIEDKGLSLAVHYRQAPRKSEALSRILLAAQRLPHARVYGGKHVVNVVAQGDPHKGIVLLAERDRLRCDIALYVGDDQNDEDAFAINGRIVSVRVGKARGSHADFYLRNQSQVDTLLQTMVSLREQLPPTSPPRAFK